jgi:hypothetical protein
MEEKYHGCIKNYNLYNIMDRYRDTRFNRITTLLLGHRRYVIKLDQKERPP